MVQEKRGEKEAEERGEERTERGEWEFDELK